MFSFVRLHFPLSNIPAFRFSSFATMICYEILKWPVFPPVSILILSIAPFSPICCDTRLLDVLANQFVLTCIDEASSLVLSAEHVHRTQHTIGSYSYCVYALSNLRCAVLCLRRIRAAMWGVSLAHPLSNRKAVGSTCADKQVTVDKKEPQLIRYIMETLVRRIGKNPTA